MNREQIMAWLLEGDVSVQYQVCRDLLGIEKKDIQDRIAKEGWGHKYLSKRNSNGHWGDRFYQPKWISTHYTLLDLRNLCFPQNNEIVRETIEFILIHQLYLSDRTNQIINKDFLKLTYPCRWKYDILRALDFFQYDGIEWDNRIEAALGILKSKRNNEGTWNMQAAHAERSVRKITLN